jgi:nucleoside-diphosphate-sugar epimerase
VAEALALLAGREAALGRFETFHVAGHWDADDMALAAAICHAGKAAGGRRPRLHRLPWPLLGLASPFVPLLRELFEMRHLWREPLRLDNTRLLHLLGKEPRTPLDMAVRDTLAGLGCLAAPRQAAT